MSAENSDENRSRQVEEIEALCAIYNEDFITIDRDNNIYEIWIQSDNSSKRLASLRFVLPPGYPCLDSPVFEVQCELLCSDDEVKLIEEFHQIAQENAGECFVFQWAEKLREIVEKKASEMQEQQEAMSSLVQESEDVTNDSEELLVESLLDTMKDTSIQDATLTLYNNTQDYEPEFDIVHGEPITDRKSTFQAHLAIVHSKSHVDQVLFELKLNRKISNASHNIMAYRIFNPEKNAYIQDCDDDGENAAGSRLLHLLQICDVKDVVLVVTRWYGGLMLGPDRFKHINNCARNVLESYGLVGGKKGNESKELKGKRTNKAKKIK